MYAAAAGNDTNSGTSPTSPKTLRGASSVSAPGSVICLLGGTYSLPQTFYPAKSGTASAWIVYKNYGDSAVNLVWAGGTSASDRNMWHFHSSSLSTGVHNFTYSDPAQFLNVDPLFVNPPVLDPAKDGQYATALPPAQLGSGLVLQSTSPAIDTGVNPTTLGGVAPEIRAGLRPYVLQDVNGTPRPRGGGFDIGAYESFVVPPAVLRQLTIGPP